MLDPIDFAGLLEVGRLLLSIKKYSLLLDEYHICLTVTDTSSV
jgi:hypothetical protein